MFICWSARKVLQKCGPKALQQIRNLNLQEHQSKKLLKKYGCAVQHFIVVNSKEDAVEKLKNFGTPPFKKLLAEGRTDDERFHYVVKALVLAGGRGKGKFIDGRSDMGGVFLTRDQDEVVNAVGEMINKRLVTKQTGKDGLLVKEVMIAEGVAIKRETYVAILMDRELSCPVVVHSPAGGMDIETVASTKPHLLFKEPIDVFKGMSDDQALKIAENLQFKGSAAKKAASEVKHLYDLFISVDATQVEINPLVESTDGEAYCLDAKLNFDDSAEYRQKDIFALGATGEITRETRAKKFHLNYIPLDGNIACLVNGAGLAMATMDIIKLYGGNPANFLDVGGAVTEEAVAAAFRIILSDPKVQGILVNIFGGIVNCQTIATGLIDAFKSIDLKIPLIVRLEGTNVENARALLERSGLPITTATDLEEAAQKVVSLVRK